MCSTLLTRETNLGAELLDLDFAEWLYKDITKLLICSNKTHLDLSIDCILPDKIKHNVVMFMKQIIRCSIKSINSFYLLFRLKIYFKLFRFSL